MRDLSHITTSYLLLSRVNLSKVVPLLARTWDFLISNLLELHLKAFVRVFFVCFQIFSKHASIILQVWVRVHALDIVEISFFQLSTCVVVLFVNWGEIDIL